MLRHLTSTSLLLAATGSAQLFQGLETQPPMRSTTLAGFPNVSYQNLAAFAVNGMASLGDGRTLLIATGPFTTDIYRSILGGTPGQPLRAGIDLHGLGYGRNTLFGFSNFGSPMGIYAIDLSTGAATLQQDTSAAGLRYFALDYNPVDDLLYGYSEYGNSGLYAIDLDAHTQTRVAPPIPAANTQGRGLAVGNHTVYLTATRGGDGVPCYAWDLGQGSTGSWAPFTAAYPADTATGGSTFVEVVQPWLGYRGPGRVTVSCTGQALATGGTARFRIHSALAGASGYLLLGVTSNPTFVPGLGATIAPYPPLAIAPLTVDSRGWLDATLPGGGGPFSLVVQVLLRDAAVATGFSVSNAVRLEFRP